MNFSIKNVVLGLIVAFATTSAFGQLSFVGGGNNVTFSGSFGDAASAANLPAGTQTYQLFATTESDLLLIDASLRVVQGEFHNATAAELGSDVAPAAAALLGAFPGLAADSWVTTNDPSTAAAGSNTLASGLQITHFDTITNPAIAEPFQWGQITIIPDADTGLIEATLEGTIQTAASPTPIFDDFTYTFGVPEPSSMGLVLSALLGGLAIIRRKRN